MRNVVRVLAHLKKPAFWASTLDFLLLAYSFLLPASLAQSFQ
jgi:hypothetical protein